MNCRVVRAFTVLSGAISLLILAGCASTPVRGPLDAARLAAIGQQRASHMLDQPGPCRDWFVSRGIAEPGLTLRDLDVRVVWLSPIGEIVQEGELYRVYHPQRVAGTPLGQSRLVFVDGGLFAALSRRGATVAMIHEFAHIVTPEITIKEDAEAVANYVEQLCFGSRGDIWELEAWNKRGNG